MDAKPMNPTQHLWKQYYCSPLKVPALVQRGWAITALCALLAVPLFFPILYAYRLLFHAAAPLSGTPIEPPLSLVFVTSVMVCTVPPLYLVFRATSRFGVQVIMHYWTHDDPIAAETVALGVDYQIWWRDVKNNPSFRRFLVERGLAEKSKRYQKFLAKAGERAQP